MIKKAQQGLSRVRGNVLGLLLSLLILGSTPFSSYLWTFIPLGMAFFLERHWIMAVALGLLSLTTTIVLQREALSDLDFFGIGFLFIGGVVLYLWGQRGRSFYRVLFYFALGVSALSLGLFLIQKFTLSTEIFDLWVTTESRGNLLPIVFAEQYWPEGLEQVYQIILPLYQITFLGWFLVSMILSFLFSGLLLRLYQTPSANRRFWVEFSLWRAPDWVLIPLVVSLVLLALQVPQLVPKEFTWLSWGAWNLFLLSLLPLMFSGMSLLAWLLPRLSYFFLFIVFFLLVVYTLPVLTLTGLVDIWFDLRRKLRSTPAPGE